MNVRIRPQNQIYLGKYSFDQKESDSISVITKITAEKLSGSISEQNTYKRGCYRCILLDLHRLSIAS